MAYSKWYITGDVHGIFNRFQRLQKKKNIAVIILGDSGVNWTFDEYDSNFKKSIGIKYPNITFYLVRGNHDGRPQNIHNIKVIYDKEVDGDIYIEPEFPYIRYFIDGNDYWIAGYKILVIGGAYSVDKDYRLSTGRVWHKDEQLTAEEMQEISKSVYKQDYDIVLTHTCPSSFIPVDLFLSGIDQSKVDKTMEYWLEDISKTFHWKYWIFGHYHADRFQAPNVQIMYWDIKPLDEILRRIDT